ncbi:MAG: thioredoxin family protein [Xanthomonadaceae bacterium]|nr:thioredoxin family protein [Xanthomonadaceae bacterium]
MRKTILISAIFSCFLGSFSFASSVKKDPSPHSEAKLLTDSSHKRIGFWLKMDSHWHTYWKNPGDSGLPVRFEWELPSGMTVQEREWPTPERVETAGITTFGYEDELLVSFDVGTNVQTPVEIKLIAKWLICEKVCLPASAELKAQYIPTETTDSKTAALFAEFEKKTPTALVGKNSVEVSDDSLEWNIDLSSLKTMPKRFEFFIQEKGIVDYSVPVKISRNKNILSLKQKKSEYAKSTPAELHGILKLTPFNSFFVTAINKTPVTITNETSSISSLLNSTDLGFITALLFAFLGGIILNLMPCVLPVISIKALGLIKHSGSRGEMTKKGLLFLLGVLTSFWVLVGALFILRAGGESIGWGFQLQSPLFVGLLASLMLAMSLNLLGVFEFGHSFALVSSRVQTEHPLVESFLSGILTTLVSTPCSAPFMGSALGYALSRPPVESWIIFTALGLGVAAPFTLVSLVPGFLRFLPKPGAWMDTFKKLLSLPLFATVGWLVWVYALQTEQSTLIGLGVSLVFLTIALIVYGRMISNPKGSTPVRSVLILVMGILFLSIFPWKPRISAPSSHDHTAGIWQPYSRELLETNLKMGKSVFVDFTAAWCLSCQVNKKLVLAQPDIEKAFTESGIVTLEADWTNENPAITDALQKLGRSGVPVYVFYKGNQHFILPEVLTKQIVTDAIERNKK